MPNELTTRMTPTEIYVGEVLPSNSDAMAVLAELGVDAKRFRHTLAQAIMHRPEILKVPQGFTYRAVSDAASLGLFLDPQLGESYLVVVRNNKKNRDEVQLRIGYKGYMRLARQTGDVSLIYAHPVHERDLFRCRLGADPELTHEPNVFGERGGIVGYYAVMRFKDGTYDFETMTVKQIHDIRARSDGYRAFKAGRIKSTPWSTDEVEMSRKTVIRRLLKRAPLNPRAAMVLAKVEADEDGEERIEDEAVQATKRTKATEQVRAIANGEDEAAPAPRKGPGRPRKEAAPERERDEEEEAVIEADPDTGEIISDENAEAIHRMHSPADDEDERDERPAVHATVSPPDDDEQETDYTIDPKGADYERGAADFKKGLAKCLSTTIRENPARFANWRAGFEEARDVTGR